MPELLTTVPKKIELRGPVSSSSILRFHTYVLAAFIFLYFLLPSPALLTLGWQYLGGGPELEKIHPATYLLFLGFCVSLAIDRHFRGRVIACVTHDSTMVAFALAVVTAATYCYLVQNTSLAPFIETFISAIIATIVLSCVSLRTISFLRRLIEIFFLVNIAMIFWEAATNTTFFPRNLIGVGNSSDVLNNLGYEEIATLSRPSALFSHPLEAAMLLGVYSISSLVSMPAKLSAAAVAKLIMLFLSYGSIFPTASRSSMVATTIAMVAYVLFASMASGMRGYINKINLGYVLSTVVLLMPVGLVLWDFGFFDAMLYRFQDDYGSALAREGALQILERASVFDLWFGLPQQDVFALQQRYGLIALEISWVNFILVGGLITAVPLFVTYLLFLFRSMRLYCVSGIYFVSLLIFIASSSSNGIWSKTASLTMSFAVAISFLRRDVSP
jgi:hypothetical protein